MSAMSSAAPLLSVIVLNWNTPADTLTCLERVAHSRYPNLRVVVVDNGSTDDSVARIRRAWPDLPLLCNRANLGYAEGNNVGIRYSLAQGAAYIVLLNSDAFVEPDTFDHMISAALADSGVGAVGCKVPFASEPERLWAAGEGFPRRLYPRDDGRYDTPREIRYAVGCCILLSRAALAEVGLLDPLFFAYFEEQEWCLRARRAGYRIVYEPRAVVYHKVAASLGSDAPAYNYLFVRNFLQFSEHANRVPTGWWRIHTTLLVWWNESAQILFYPGQRRMRRIWAAARGALDFLHGRSGPPPAHL